MKEDDVFWLGGKPGGLKKEEAPRLADDETFVEAIRAVCEKAGCDVKRFVSAMGVYGTWIVEMKRNGESQRVLWNGRTERLVLQVELPNGGWEDPHSIEVMQQDADGFAQSVLRLLSETNDSNA